MANEVKIGILALLTIVIGIWGFKFMKGQDLFSNATTIFVAYDNADQLTASSPVLLNGFTVGSVANVQLDPENINSIKVTLSIDSGVPIHKDAIAEIGSSIMGGKYVVISNNKACQGATCVPDQGEINGIRLGILGSMLPQNEIDSYMKAVRENLGGMVDTLNQKINDPSEDNKIGQSVRDLQASLANLKKSTEQLSSIMQQNSGNINRTMSNMAKLTNTLANNNEKIEGILTNTAAFTDKLSKVDMNKTLGRADTTLEQANLAVQQLRTTLQTSDEMVSNLNEMVDKMKNGDGTLGMLLNDKKLYENLNQTSESLDQFLTDFKEKPYRYMPLKSRRRVLKHDEKDAEEEAEMQNN